MICPNCEGVSLLVIDTRHNDVKNNVRRRRLCLDCQHKFSTLEYITYTKPTDRPVGRPKREDLPYDYKN